MANRQIFQHEEDILLNDECKLLEDDANNKTKMFKLETLKNFIAEFVKDKIKSWEYDSLKTKGKNIIESANEIYDTTQKRMVSLEEIDLVTVEGFFVDALAVKELNRNLQSGYTHLSQTTNGCVEFENGLKVVYGSYNAGFMSRDSTTDGYSITIDISQYGLNNPLFALASARYDQGHPLATVHSTSVDAIKIGCNVNYDGCFIMWFVIG